jgi:hypothetical protein
LEQNHQAFNWVMDTGDDRLLLALVSSLRLLLPLLMLLQR